MSAVDIALKTLEELCQDDSVADDIKLQAAATILAHMNGFEMTFEREGDLEVDR